MPDRRKPPAPGHTAHLPIDSRHTEILGYRRTTKAGAHLWDELDWTSWWVDGPEAQIFNAGGHYLHVRVGHDPAEDGPDPKSRRWYRVRCWHAGGTYRGRKVESIGIGSEDGRLYWIVRMKG